MGIDTAFEERPQTRGEEIANSLSHGAALLAALAATPFLVVAAAGGSDAAGITGAAIFGASMILLYGASMLFHALPPGGAKRLFQLFDHGAIYLLIAGTYTPFLLGPLRGAWGWSLFGVVWGLAALGIVLKAALGPERGVKLSTGIYLAMGWLIVVAAEPAWTHIPHWGLAWLLLGGVAYTLGVLFFLAERVRYFHFVWHLFVVAGTACHFVAVVNYAV
ncbi:MAG: hemolysin III family protein [Gammaproteobacteria bacterium]